MSKTVCIVDDQNSLRQMLRFALNIHGMTVIEAEHGLDAFDQLAGHNIDLMIVDWQMPKMDGLEFVRQLRKYKEHTELPIIMISCHDDLEARREARTLGVLAWLKKPFRISEIQLAVKNALEPRPSMDQQFVDRLNQGLS